MDPRVERIHKAADFIRDILERAGLLPKVGIVLGSGLGKLTDIIENPVTIPYKNIPGFPVSTAIGHKGNFIAGYLSGKPVIAMQGRLHYYEGYDTDTVTLPIRVMKVLGIDYLFVSNAAGGVNTSFHTGDLMIITDHINMIPNPLIGPNMEEFGPRFPDMTYTYNKELREKLIKAAAAKGIRLREGVYAMFTGPSFETPAEIRFARIIGADAVGMSTVPEAIIANHAGREIIGISFLSNMAAGVLDKPLTGAEVTEAAMRIKDTFAEVVDLAIEI